jgi:hypothetical protein
VKVERRGCFGSRTGGSVVPRKKKSRYQIMLAGRWASLVASTSEEAARAKTDAS